MLPKNRDFDKLESGLNFTNIEVIKGIYDA